MTVGKLIDVPVKQNALLNAFGPWLMALQSFQMVGHEVAQHDFGIATRKIKVGKVIHVNKLMK
jgi:hypothetical protein